MVTSQSKRRQIHHFQFFLKHIVVSQLIIQLCIRVGYRVSAVNTIYFGRFENDISFNFNTTQTRSRIRSKERIACTRSKNHHSALAQFANRIRPAVIVTHTI
ncbi:Uncharacterised protein [Vibrio cholerae]|nr:Uncharacterised protein [Vibrio cholerae]